MTPLCVGITEAAATLGVSPWTVRNYVASGLIAPMDLPSVKRPGETSRRILIAVAELERFVARHTAKGAR